MTKSSAHFGLAAMFVAGFLPGALRADDWNKHWNTGAKPELRVHAGDASVVIQAGDASGISARLTTRGWTIGRGGVQVVEHQTGDTVDLDIRVPNSSFRMLGNRSIRLELQVPRDLVSDIHTGDGSINLNGLHGVQRVSTGDGSVHGEDLDGALEVHTGDGSVQMTGRFDDLQLHTQDGSVDLNARSGSKVQTAWHLETGDGSVHVSLPRDLKADLELRTGDGHLQVDMPNVSTQNKTEHEFRGSLNGGGRMLLVRTGDGSISFGGH